MRGRRSGDRRRLKTNLEPQRTRRNTKGKNMGEADPRAEPAATGAEQSSLREGSLAVWREAPKRNDPPVSLPRRLRVEPVDQFLYVSCQVLQLLTLEAASRKR